MASSLALLSGAQPRTCAIGPKVKLQPGTWTLIIHGLRDTILALSVEGPTVNTKYDVINDETKIIITEYSVVQVEFINRGLENHLSVFLKKVA
jgi:hypothetical protein